MSAMTSTKKSKRMLRKQEDRAARQRELNRKGSPYGNTGFRKSRAPNHRGW